MLAFCQGTQRAGGEHGTGEYLLMDEHYQVLSYIDDPFALTVPGRPPRGFSAKRPGSSRIRLHPRRSTCVST